jgi:CheY-like chemotaxis protein
MMTILYADDDAEDRELMSEALSQVDPEISCIVADHGLTAIEILEGADQLPDYIFLDVNMPIMNGKETLQKLKKDERYREIPVIIYSTTSNQEEIGELYSLGAATFIRKHNNFERMCATLETFVKLVQAGS